MKSLLRTHLGFQNGNIVLLEDASKSRMEEEVDNLCAKVRRAGPDQRTVLLFFFAGHGMQKDDDNLLSPVDDSFDDFSSSVSHQSIMHRFNEVGPSLTVSIHILDCCRVSPYRPAGDVPRGRQLDVPLPLYDPNNPNCLPLKSYQNRLPLKSHDMSHNQSPNHIGHIIMFACSFNQTASDGPRGENGAFTGCLLRVFGAGTCQDVVVQFREVVKQFQELSGGKQVAWVHNWLTGDFSFQLLN